MRSAVGTENSGWKGRIVTTVVWASVPCRLAQARAPFSFQGNDFECVRSGRAGERTDVAEGVELMATLLPFEGNELEFLEQLNGMGEIVPELLTDVPEMQAALRGHPAPTPSSVPPVVMVAMPSSSSASTD
jgi:hypothetical protein